jgi:5-methylcytosine-specific restriction protein A
MATELTTKQWIEILQNNEITKELDLAIFQALYSFEGHKAYASQAGLILGIHHGSLNFEVGRYAKRIAEHYDINFTARSEKKYKFWDLFLTDG